MKPLLLIVVMISLSSACGKERHEVANATASARSCPKTHSNIGATGVFSSKQHGVAGKATVVSDCEIEIQDFRYDGKGIDVRVYGSRNGDFVNGISLSDDLTGRAYGGETFSVFLPEGRSFDDIDSLSIWCVDFAVDFGSLSLR